MGRGKGKNRGKEMGMQVYYVLMVCPECEVENKAKCVDYDMNKKNDGVKYIYECSLCKKKFSRERKFSEF